MHNKKILIVDDDAINRKLLSVTLQKTGYEVIEAENGVEALSKLTPEISLILLDLKMPVMDGIQFMEELKVKKPEFLNIPILVLTTDDSKKEEAKLAGAREVLIKPISPIELPDKISDYL
jgi:CheY-like chemotaxis protein